ncbi:MAG: hypothetical protein K0U93_17970, partial [Gammaproteobacteria bacterium]|nr:hypothetical protein [Gammaproteobacteria bacterium]
MLNHDGYASLTHLYDAAINQSRWRRALDAVASAVGGEAIALLIRRADPSFKDLTMLNSAYLGLTRTPAGIYYGLVLSRLQNPDWEFLSRQPVHHPTPDTAIGPTAEQLDKRRDYAFLRKRLGISRRLGIRLNSDKVWFDAMSIAFSSEHSNAP